MEKHRYYIEALQNNAYTRMSWIIDCFTVSEYIEIEQGGGDGNTYDDCYPYQLVTLSTDKESLYFADPNEKVFTKIDGWKKDEPLFRFLDVIELEVNDLVSVKEKIKTTYGNALVNCYVLINAFGSKIPFVTGKFKGDEIHKIIIPKLRDVPKENEQRQHDLFYVDEFVKYCDAVSSLEGLTMLAAPSVTVETFTPSKGVLELRDQLFEKHKHELDNPAIVTAIAKQLADYERQALKGTEASGYYLSSKSYEVTRMKRFIMYGLEGGFGDEAPTFIGKSLNEGWDLNNFPQMVDGFRSGSYGRGKETAAGGEWVKHFQRIFQNISLVTDDCGNNHGMKWLITDFNYKRFIGLNRVLAGSKFETITDEMAKSFIGQIIEVRTPMLCHGEQPNFCKACCGVAISNSPDALHSITARVGSVFMNTRMKKMHGKVAASVEYDIATAFS